MARAIHFSFAVVTSLVMSGCSRTIDLEKARSSLNGQLAEIRRAVLELDHAKLADLTHPAVIKGTGGKKAFVDMLHKENETMTRKGFKFTEVVLEDPSDVVENTGELFVIAPYSLLLSGPENTSGSIKGYFVGTSTDRGRTWSFIDGDGIRGDRARLKSIVPAFPDSLKLPKSGEPAWFK